jgi:hypothetical protein
MVAVGRPVSSGMSPRPPSRQSNDKVNHPSRTVLSSLLHGINIIGCAVGLYRQRSNIFCLGIGLAVLVIFGMNVVPRDRMVQKLNLNLGTKRKGQGQEVRAVLPITVRPMTGMTPFVGRRCRTAGSRNQWWRDYLVCEECASDGQCSVLHPRDRLCRQPPADESSVMAQVTSQYNAKSAELISFSKVLPTAHQPEYSLHPHCSIEACWDFKRCQQQSNDGFLMMTVYLMALPSTPPNLVWRFTKSLGESIDIEVVTKPEDACLVVLFGATDSQPSETTMINDVIGSGQNLLVWDVSMLGIHGLHFGKAVLASRNGLHAWMRVEYDIILPHHEPKLTVDESSKVSNLLLSCAMTKADTLPAWIAHQHWEEPHAGENVVAAVPICRQSSVAKLNTIVNSTFTFIPDGPALLSHTIAIGSIPVVMNWSILPFWPDIPWDQCVYQVDPIRIVDLPRLLSQVPVADIQNRRRICQGLGRRVFGAKEAEKDAHSFMVGVSTMRDRVKRAQQLRSVLEELMDQ